jgi:hypothetical protein
MTGGAWTGSRRTLGLWAALVVALAPGCGGEVTMPPGAAGTVAGCEGGDCGGPSPGEGPPIYGEPGQTPEMRRPPTEQPPPPDPRRPPEIVDVMPPEDTAWDPNPKDDCPMCTEPGLDRIAAWARFPGEDAAAAGRMWIDGAEVPVQTRPVSMPRRPEDPDSLVAHDLYRRPLAAGLHEATVEVTSREGQVVTYTWRFTFTEPGP